MSLFTLTLRALGRIHVASAPCKSPRNALFLLNSRVPRVRDSSGFGLAGVAQWAVLAGARRQPAAGAGGHAKISAPRTPPPTANAPRPAKRRTTAHRPRSTQSQFLVPKLRIQFADFTYLPSLSRPEAAHLGDLMRFPVRPHTRLVVIHRHELFTGAIVGAPPGLPVAWGAKRPKKGHNANPLAGPSRHTRHPDP